MVFIYAIKLEQGKYYIGKTNIPQFRLESHFNLDGEYIICCYHCGRENHYTSTHINGYYLNH